MKTVLGIGNALVDVLIHPVEDTFLSGFKLEKGSMTLVDKEKADDVLSAVASGDRQRSSGGSAANTIHGLAKLGAPVGYIGKIGDDEWGEFFRSYMGHHNICATLFTGKQESGKSIVLISKDCERTFATYLGAAIELGPADLTPEPFQGYDYFHLEGYLVQNHALVEAAVKLAKQTGIEIAIDLASYNVVKANLNFLRKITAEYIDIVFANEEEAEAFTGKADPEEALSVIAETSKIAVVKIGKEGSLIARGDERYRISPIKAKAIDTTGAGDLYASGFFYGLINGHTLDICGKIGSITSGKIVEVLGAKMDDSKWDEVFQMVKEVTKKS